MQAYKLLGARCNSFDVHVLSKEEIVVFTEDARESCIERGWNNAVTKHADIRWEDAIDSCCVIITLELANEERAYVAESGHSLVSSTTSCESAFVHRTFWIYQTNLSKCFEDLILNSLLYIRLNSQAFVIHPKICELERNTDLRLIIEVELFLWLLDVIASMLLFIDK